MLDRLRIRQEKGFKYQERVKILKTKMVLGLEQNRSFLVVTRFVTRSKFDTPWGKYRSPLGDN